MKKVRYLRSFAGVRGSIPAGTVKDVEDDLADRLIARGFAELVKEVRAKKRRKSVVKPKEDA
jgi:hypothetical protein